MELKDIEAFIALAKKEGVCSLKYESEDIKISVVLPVQAVQGQFYGVPSTPGPQYVRESSIQEIPPVSGKYSESSNYHKITSPFVGTFYTSPSPSESAYVKTGDRVKKGQVLCIVEAMKIMNEIDSDVAGEIVEMCVENESLVEYGQVLFLIKVS